MDELEARHSEAPQKGAFGSGKAVVGATPSFAAPQPRAHSRAEEVGGVYVVVAVHPPQPITTRMPVSSQPPPTM
jgi:hypothetical protein